MTCIVIPALPDPQQLTLPGGVTIEQINLLQVVQPALTPVVPLFDLVDAFVAVLDCVKAIPAALGPPPDPSVLAACVPALAQKVDKLLRLVPQLALPVLVGQLVGLVVDTVERARTELLQLAAQEQQVAGVVARAEALGDSGLLGIAACARANLAQEAANIGKSLASLGRLTGILNLFLGMLGGPVVPALVDVSGQPLTSAIAALTSLLATLHTIRALVPAP